MKPSVLWLEDPRSQKRDLTGGKCATLARLLELGYPVPAGFCVTTEAVSAGPDAYEDAAGSLARLSPPWAVRSSATVEDVAGHLFPGLFATRLGLVGESSALEAIEQVGVGRTEAVGAYAKRLGVDPSAIRVAVLVQTLVPAAAAGVAFSRDPVDGERRVLIEANHGLGVTVVDGSVEPDRFSIEGGGEISRSLGSKRQKVVFDLGGEGVVRVETDEAERSRPALDDEGVAAVAAIARRLETDLGHPVDLEWALVSGGVQVLQARPVAA
jgi:phosphoenolpyruvate synthase/pyruvate phosphate dikinase